MPHDCGGASKTHLEFILTGANVECEKNGKDRWGLTCTIYGTCIEENANMCNIQNMFYLRLSCRKT